MGVRADPRPRFLSHCNFDVHVVLQDPAKGMRFLLLLLLARSGILVLKVFKVPYQEFAGQQRMS